MQTGISEKSDLPLVNRMRAEGKISNVPSACKLPLILAVPYHFSEFILYVPVTNTQLLLPRSNHFAVILTLSQPIKQEVKTQGTFKGSTLLKGEGNGTPLQYSCLDAFLMYAVGIIVNVGTVGQYSAARPSKISEDPHCMLLSHFSRVRLCATP